jgi:uncharacterized membrane protein
MDLPLHPMLVHLPLALAILIPLLASGLLIAIWRSWLPRRVWSIVAAAQLLLVGSGVLAMRTGEADEHRVEKAVPKAALERHEEAAEVFVWAGGILLVFSILPLVFRSSKTVLLSGAATVLGSFGVLGLGFQVGQAGGEIVYRHAAPAIFGVPAAPAAGEVRKVNRDDDR